MLLRVLDNSSSFHTFKCVILVCDHSTLEYNLNIANISQDNIQESRRGVGIPRSDAKK